MAQSDEQTDAVTLAEQIAALGESVDGVSKLGRAFLAGAETALRPADSASTVNSAFLDGAETARRALPARE